MDINNYFDGLNKKIEEMTDEEFKQLLIDSGLEKCPLEDKENSFRDLYKIGDELRELLFSDLTDDEIKELIIESIKEYREE